MTVQMQNEPEDENIQPPRLGIWKDVPRYEEFWSDRLSYIISSLLIPLSCLAIIAANCALGIKLIRDTYETSYSATWPYHAAFAIVFCGSLWLIEHILSYTRKNV